MEPSATLKGLRVVNITVDLEGNFAAYLKRAMKRPKEDAQAGFEDSEP